MTMEYPDTNDQSNEITPESIEEMWEENDSIDNEATQQTEEEKYKKAREQAKSIWDAARPAPEIHQYLKDKGIKPHNARLVKDRLVIPIMDARGDLQSLQFIYPGGKKIFLPNGQTKGFYHTIGTIDLKEPIYVAEGFATAATIHEASGKAVVVAFTVGNLCDVCRSIQGRYPNAWIIICADNDAWTTKNPGVTSALDAAREIGGSVIVPTFSKIDSKPTDFNDLARLEGLGCVQAQLRNPRRRTHFIHVQTGCLPQMLDRIEGIICMENEKWQIYQRGGILVRTATMPELDSSSGVVRPKGSLTIIPITTPHALLDIFNRAASWIRWCKKNYIPADCPLQVAEIYLNKTGSWHVPMLSGVLEAPTIRPDGNIVSKTGYDKETGIYLRLTEEWSDIPNHPSKSEAEAAVKILLEPFDQFPFDTLVDKSVVLAAILTAIQRRTIKTAPLIAITSPTPGTGKGLIADIIAIIATGRNSPAMPQGGNDEQELRKRVTSILLNGDLIINLDNIVHPLDGDALCTVLTQEHYQDRILGKSQTVRLPTTILWLATGNNLTFAGDMVRRGLLCKIDAKQERPDQRKFNIRDLRRHVASKRKELVTAALTILKAFHVAGSPAQEVTPFGSFEDWDSKVRWPLIWLNQPDPCLSREKLVLQDPVLEGIQNVLESWFESVGDKPVTLQELKKRAEYPDGDEVLEELLGALLNIAGQGSNINNWRLGRWCKTHVGRPVAGLQLVQTSQKRHGVQLWQVVKIGGSSSGTLHGNDNSHASNNDDLKEGTI